MIEALFLLIWTVLFISIVFLLWMKNRRHTKMYWLMVLNFMYLTALFLIFPRIGEWIRWFYEYLG